MKIDEFVARFNNHPVLFVGTGISLRYLDNTYTWDHLLKYISDKLTQNPEKYYDIKAKYHDKGEFAYDKVASHLEEIFEEIVQRERDGEFSEINDTYYENMSKGIKVSRFKLYVATLFNELNYKGSKIGELKALKKVRKNIGSIVTTNYDRLIEDIFEFNPLIGNDILLSNPYGSVYKIHGCSTDSERIIITNEDYEVFEQKYELIRAQLLSLFIHNPIIFLGYSMGDKNIKDILRTIYNYVEPNSATAKKIHSNFLLVEYEKDSTNLEVVEHDIVLNENQTIRINKMKTDNYLSIYTALANLQLPVSAMDVRKVQSIVKEIYAGGSIKVSITEDLNQLANEDKVLVIGSEKTISYEFQTTSEMMINYFEIIEEENSQLVSLIDKIAIQSQQYFPIFGFYSLNNQISKAALLMAQQEEKLKYLIDSLPEICRKTFSSIVEIIEDAEVVKSHKINTIVHSVMNKEIPLTDVEHYLRNFENKTDTDYRKILCAYDLIKFKHVDKDLVE